jgi:hypothetical protein
MNGLLIGLTGGQWATDHVVGLLAIDDLDIWQSAGASADRARQATGRPKSPNDHANIGIIHGSILDSVRERSGAQNTPNPVAPEIRFILRRLIQVILLYNLLSKRKGEEEPMARPNYSFEKRQKDLAKKRKKEEKRLRKAAAAGASSDETQPTGAPPAETPPTETNPDQGQL